MPLQVNKPKGMTCGELINLHRKNIEDGTEEKICYSGRLDPMARGIVLLLIGDETKQQSFYNMKDKTYQFEIVFGISTDTDDILGNIQKTMPVNSISQFIELFENFQKTYDQSYHNFSSFVPQEKYEGKRYCLWWWSTKHPETISLPKYQKSVSIYKRKIIAIGSIGGKMLKPQILTDLNLMNDQIGENFNKKKFIQQWETYLFVEEYCKITLEVTVSSGFYIRQFVRDLSDTLTIPILVTDINRILI